VNISDVISEDNMLKEGPTYGEGSKCPLKSSQLRPKERSLGGRTDAAYRGETITWDEYGHITKTNDPTIFSPNPNPTHPKDGGACIVAKISGFESSVVEGVIEKATQTPEPTSHA
jgi:hypothetical protein